MANDLFLGLAQGLDPRNIFSVSYELKELSTYKVGGQTSFYAKIFDFENTCHLRILGFQERRKHQCRCIIEH